MILADVPQRGIYACAYSATLHLTGGTEGGPFCTQLSLRHDMTENPSAISNWPHFLSEAEAQCKIWSPLQGELTGNAMLLTINV